MSEVKVVAGRYEMEALIGQGGMGDVYRARDTRTGERVAIKSLKEEILTAQPDLLERFEREGDILRKLNHPSIVKILGMVNDDDRHYLIMEYVEGGSLADLLKEQPRLPIDRVLEIALDLADALTRAHRLGVVHRDIKPANVLIAADGTPRLTDFGTAHIGDRTRLTEAGTVIGTYAYLSPEACNGLELDARTDIWAFGVMLYEMLAGRRPFNQTQPGSVITAILTQAPPDLLSLRPEIPLALAGLINQMLEKDRTRRISSVRLVGADIETLIREGDTALRSADGLAARVAREPSASRFADSTPSGERVTQPGLPAGDRDSTIVLAPAPARARRWIVPGALAALIILAVAAGAYLISQQANARPVLVEPVSPGETMILVADLERIGSADERDVARFIYEDLDRSLTQGVPFSSLRVRRYPKVIASAEEAIAAAEANGATVVVWGNYAADLIELEVQIGVLDDFAKIDMPRAALEQAANVRVRLADERRESVAPQVLGVLAVLHTADGNGYELMRTVAILDLIQVPGGEAVGSGVSAHTHRAIGSFFDSNEALAQIDEAIALEASNPILYAVHSILAFRQSQYETALQDIGTAAQLGPTDWTMPLYLQGNFDLRGTDMSYLENLDDAIGTYTRIIEQRPDDWFPLHVRGSLYYLSGDSARAAADFEQVLTMQPDANFPYAFATMLALRKERLDEAASLMDAALAQFPSPVYGNRILATTSGDMGPTNIFGPLFSAYGNLVLGQYEAAIGDADLALRMNNQLPDLYLIKGLAQCRLARYEEAEASYSQALELDSEFAVLYLLRADVRSRLGDNQGVQDDAAALSASGLSELSEAVGAGDLTCDNLFD